MKTSDKKNVDGRREIASRSTSWARYIAHKLTIWGASPNQISMASIFFALCGCAVLIFANESASFNKYLAFALFICCIQLRLLSNLFDGMVAVEGGKQSVNGDLYNDVPDRLSDALFIVPIGYIAGGVGVELGWVAALMAISTAYLRWMGSYKTGVHYFSGPMAKPHRMALLTATCLAAMIALPFGNERLVCLIGLIVMNIGLVVTLARRLYFIAHTPNQPKP